MSLQQLKTFAMVFPGQGSQSLGMLTELSQEFPEVIQTFAEASDVVNYDLWQLVQQGPEEKLNKTEYTQPALLAADIAVWRCWLMQTGLQPSLLAGHSLGEYAALVCAEAIKFTDAIALVAKRGAYMQQAVAEDVGAMAAIIGLDNKQVLQICDQAMENGNYVASPANFNAIGQTVIAGHAIAIDKAIEFAKLMGAKIAKRIPVSVPSHCILMQSAAFALAKDLKNVHINQPVLAVIHNFDVTIHDNIDTIRQALIEQLIHSVRWVETVEKMVQNGIEVVVECGPGKVLTGLNKRITTQLTTYPTADLTQFAAAKISIENVLRGVSVCH